jgi:hypothetical protein
VAQGNELQARASRAHVLALVGFADGARNAQWTSLLNPLQAAAYCGDRRYVTVSSGAGKADRRAEQHRLKIGCRVICLATAPEFPVYKRL